MDMERKLNVNVMREENDEKDTLLRRDEMKVYQQQPPTNKMCYIIIIKLIKIILIITVLIEIMRIRIRQKLLRYQMDTKWGADIEISNNRYYNYCNIFSCYSHYNF